MENAELQVLVRKAARALGRNGLAHAYGHVSARIDAERFLVCAPMPMGLVPEGEEGTIVPIDGPLPDGVLGEVRIHREIYKRRPEIGGVTRSMPPKLMSLSTLRRTPKPRHGFGAYFYPQIPLWDDPILIRNDAAAEELAMQMGANSAIMMRGNGLVTAGATLEEAVVRAWYAEDAARVELEVSAAQMPEDQPAFFDEATAVARAVWGGQILERMWDYLTFGDPE